MSLCRYLVLLVSISPVIIVDAAEVEKPKAFSYQADYWSMPALKVQPQPIDQAEIEWFSFKQSAIDSKEDHLTQDSVLDGTRAEVRSHINWRSEKSIRAEFGQKGVDELRSLQRIPTESHFDGSQKKHGYNPNNATTPHYFKAQ